MKLIGNIIGCIIGLVSLVFLSCCLLLLALIARDGYKCAKRKLKEEYEKLIIRWGVVKKRYAEIFNSVQTTMSKVADALFVSSKQIAKHSVKFILMWSLPAIFMLALVAIITIDKEEKYRKQENDLEIRQRELELIKREFHLEQAIDSLNRLKSVEVPDTITRK